MERIKALYVALYSAVLSLLAFPALALAQATSGAQPSSGAAPAGGAAGNGTTGAGASGGGAGWLWIVAAIIVLAIVWWAMASRRSRQGTATR